MSQTQLPCFRQKRVKINFSDTITEDHILSLTERDLNIRLKNYSVDDGELKLKDEEMPEKDILPEPSKYDGMCIGYYDIA